MRRDQADEVILTRVLVIGSGVAGMVAALAAAPAEVVLATRSDGLPGGSSLHAQGGVAVALGPDDSPELHARDTVAAAGGLADAEAVRVLVKEGPARVRWLMGLGARFDHDRSGVLTAGREGAHSRSRVLHARGDATGAEMVRALAAEVERAPHVRILTGCLAVDLLAGNSGKVAGAAFVTRRGRRVVVRARSIVLATGGSGRLFRHTTPVPCGTPVAAGDVVLTVSGDARSILAGERTALNLLGHMSGIATLTRAMVDAVAGTGAVITDTRKTTPGLRALEKAAVRAGGGSNHRWGLHDAVMIKDNHLALAGSVGEAVRRARSAVGHTVKIEVEVETLEQLAEALDAGADIVLLDNMPPGLLREAVAMAKGRAVTEASGGVTLATVRQVAETGVDVISAGALTHSAPALDVSLELVPA